MNLKQVRYFGNDNIEWNYPQSTNLNSLVDGSVFKDALPAAKIRIQAPPGTEFLFNYNLNTCIVDDSGIFEIDFGKEQLIHHLLFSDESINNINENILGGLLVDIWYIGTEIETDVSSILESSKEIKEETN